MKMTYQSELFQKTSCIPEYYIENFLENESLVWLEIQEKGIKNAKNPIGRL